MKRDVPIWERVKVKDKTLATEFLLVVSTYQKVADAIVSLERNIDPRQIIMPIGLDGAVAYHLLHYRWGRRELKTADHLQNTLQATSRFDEIDVLKFCGLLERGYATGRSVYGLDLRTKTGKLGSMMREQAKLFPCARFLYSVLFDPNEIADLRGTNEELTDGQRSEIYWVPGFEAAGEFMRKENGVWVYNISHVSLGKLGHVQPIKDLLSG